MAQEHYVEKGRPDHNVSSASSSACATRGRYFFAIRFVFFTRDGADTVVRLSHRRLRSAAVPFHRAGWDHYLPRLSRAAAGLEPGEDPWKDLAVNVEGLREAGVAMPLPTRPPQD